MMKRKQSQHPEISAIYPAYGEQQQQQPFSQETVDFCESKRASSTVAPSNEIRCSKVIVIGDVGVGKTSLVQRFVHNAFCNDYKATIGVDFEVERFSVLGGIPYNLQIWDTAGQERFKCIASAYYRGSQAIVVTFDLTNLETMLNAEKWLKDALYEVDDEDEKPLVFLVGTKSDLLCRQEEQDSKKMSKAVRDFCDKYKAEHWPLSSLRGDNVTAFFLRVASLLFERSIQAELNSSKTKPQRAIASLEKKNNNSVSVNYKLAHFNSKCCTSF